LGLGDEAETLLDVSARVRDVGMLALPDNVVLAPTTLSPEDWGLVNRHPVIGAQLLEGLSVVASAAPIVRAHHERWDGDGYPDGLRGDAIPLLSRVLATCDAFAAMASDRPHRRGMGTETALEQIRQGRGSQFDPRVVDALVAVVTGAPSGPAADGDGARNASRQGRSAAPPAPRGRRDLASAILAFELVPAFAPAYERVLAAAASDGTRGGDLVAAIESDTGLTVAVLRRAQTVPSRRRITNVADAVAALGPTEIEEAIRRLPRAEFPWRTSPLEVLLHRFRLHAQAVTRAADRIARELGLEERDDLLVAALLHDIGKLVLGRVLPAYTIDPEGSATPEHRIRQEQRALGVDHASVGALVLRRWGLPDGLIDAVAGHHSSEAEHDIGTCVRLADMVAHHAQGRVIDRGKMLSLTRACGLSTGALRDMLFDQPHAGGSQRRRAEPSPLSHRETDVLRILAQGRAAKAIALELGVSTVTVRSHLHNAYGKLGVDDRAQAVLRATEMGWI
jgi:putative nucleotidyltransferase with HDIG domain